MKLSLKKRGEASAGGATPKPSGSRRAFFVEIGTITIGILIALAFDGAVQAWDHHDLVAHARADLRQELSDNRKTLVEALADQRQAVAGLNRVAAYNTARLAGRPASLPDSLTLKNTFSTMSTAAWESTVATQALTHMAYEDAQALTRAYSGARAYNGFQEEARKPWFELSTVAGDTASKTPAQLRESQRAVALNLSYTTSALEVGQDLLTLYDRALKRLQ